MKRMKIERLTKKDRFTDSCCGCAEHIEQGDRYFVIENRDGEHYLCCPACAAVYLAETLDAVSREYEFVDDVE